MVMKNLIKKILRENLLTEVKKTFFRRITLPYDYKSMKDFVAGSVWSSSPDKSSDLLRFRNGPEHIFPR